MKSNEGVTLIFGQLVDEYLITLYRITLRISLLKNSKSK